MAASTYPDPDPRPTWASGRFGPWLTAIWLFFLLDPLREAWAHRGQPRGVLGLVLTLAFAAAYMAVWLHARRERTHLQEQPPVAVALPMLGSLVLLGAALVVLLGEPALSCAPYVAVSGVMLMRDRVAVAFVGCVAGTVLLLGSRVPGWDNEMGVAFGVAAGSIAVFGIKQLLRRNLDLLRAHQLNASLAAENERIRLARDLHDLLGHSLTVITVKAELAQRLLDLDPARARTEVADLERLSRSALADVRRTVEGYRELTLPGELARARSALAAAEIRADLPNSTDEVPAELRELFAWAVREGITNVLRHSGARTCVVRLGRDGVEIRDDGQGCPAGAAAGSGLTGLRERAAAVGAAVVTRHLSPGFSLQVVRR